MTNPTGGTTPAPNAPPPPQPQRPAAAAPVITRHAPRRDESFMDKLKDLPWKIILFAAVLLFMLGTGTWWYANQGSSSSPVVTKPVNVATTKPGTNATPPPVAATSGSVVSGANKPTTTWFVTEVQSQPVARTTIFTTPKNLNEFVGNPPWGWLVWPLFGLAIYVLLRRNRMVASEQTDVKLFHTGLVVMIGSIVLSKPLSVLFTDVFGWMVGEVFPISPELVITFGTIINLAIQVGASMSGKADWSPLSQGCYIAGLIICWFWPDIAIRWTVGLLLMGAGFAIQVYEVKRQDHAMRSFALAVAMVTIVLVLKLLLVSLIAFALPLIPQPDDPTMAQIAGTFLSWIYRGRLVVSVAIATFVALGVGEISASFLLDVVKKTNLIQLEGQTQAREDKNTPREDAIILGLMGVQIWWAILGF